MIDIMYGSIRITGMNGRYWSKSRYSLERAFYLRVAYPETDPSGNHAYHFAFLLRCRQS